MTVIRVRHRDTGTVFRINTAESGAELTSQLGRGLGRNRRRIAYRGCVIERYTVDLTGRANVRMTAAFLSYKGRDGRRDYLCVSAGSKCNSVREAKRLIDRVLSQRVCYYGN